MFLEPKIRFVSIMVTIPFFDVLHFVFKNFHAQTAKWTFIWTFIRITTILTPPHHIIHRPDASRPHYGKKDKMPLKCRIRHRLKV
jgi:hypothetical protein